MDQGEMREMRYVVSVENILNRKKTYVFASSSVRDCRDYVHRKHRGCKLATRESDKEDDKSLIEKYVHVFNKTMHSKVIFMIRINRVELPDDGKD